MKRFLTNIVIALIVVFALAGVAADVHLYRVAHAQDATPEPVITASAPVQPSLPVYVTNEPKVLGDTIPANTFVVLVIVGGGMFLAVVGGYAYSQHTTIGALYRQSPPLVQKTGQTSLELLANEAEKTETPLDDMALDKVIDELGYDKSKLSDGRIVLTPRASPATS